MSEPLAHVDATSPSAQLEARYRRLLHAYPESWRQENGDALLGVLLDAAEARGQIRPTILETLDTAGTGLAVRAATAVPAAARDLLASSALGTGLGLTLAYFIAFSWVRADFYGGTVTSGPVWFLPAWLLIALLGLRGHPGARRVAALCAVAITILVPFLKPGPFPTVPWNDWYLSRDLHLGLTWQAQVLPPNSATVVLLIALALFTMTGTTRVRPTVIAFATSSAFFGITYALFVLLTPWPDYFGDSNWWRWPAVPPHATLGAFSVLGATSTLALLVLAVIVRRHSRARVLLAAGAITLLAATFAYSHSSPVPLGL